MWSSQIMFTQIPTKNRKLYVEENMPQEAGSYSWKPVIIAPSPVLGFAKCYLCSENFMGHLLKWTLLSGPQLPTPLCYVIACPPPAVALSVSLAIMSAPGGQGVLFCWIPRVYDTQ